jgi:uncharacterized membrane protein SpoIIM required for sporulation
VTGAAPPRTASAAFLVALVTLCAGAVVGYATFSGRSGFGTGHPDSASFARSLALIVPRNLAAASLLFSGVLTGGFSTVVGLGLLAMYIGATFGAAAGNVGALDAFTSIAAYAPVEFLGLLLAATAGLMPVVSFMYTAVTGSRPGRPGAFGTYVETVSASLRVFALAVVVIVVAATVESVVIAAR